MLHPGDIVAQTREVMARIRLALAVAGADLQDVVKINRWYRGMAVWRILNLRHWLVLPTSRSLALLPRAFLFPAMLLMGR